MEDAQRAYSHANELRDLYVSLGVYGTQSKKEHIKLVESINGLQKHVQIYKVGNERIMKSKENKDDFNIK
jgi:hypothetical protein